MYANYTLVQCQLQIKIKMRNLKRKSKQQFHFQSGGLTFKEKYIYFYIFSTEVIKLNNCILYI